MRVADLVTCEAAKVDAAARARSDAAAGRLDPPGVDETATYASQLFQGALQHVYLAAHSKRTARLSRMNEKAA